MEKHYMPTLDEQVIEDQQQNPNLEESVAGSVDLGEGESRLRGYACVASGMLAQAVRFIELIKLQYGVESWNSANMGKHFNLHHILLESLR
jgi:hypothetical protein